MGVMPEGFGFPVDDRYWIPFVVGPAERAQADAIAVTIAGRLAEGATIESAQAELTLVGARMAAAYPDTHERLRPRVLSYTRAFFDVDTPETDLDAEQLPALRRSAAGSRGGERRDPRVCAHGDARGRDRGADRARCESHASGDAVVRRGAGVVRNRCRGRAHDRGRWAREAAGDGGVGGG